MIAMHIVIAFLFRVSIYILFGLGLEVFATAISKVFIKGWNKDTKLLNGDVSVWMAPIYGLAIFFCFEPLHKIISFLPVYIRFTIWGFCFMGFEFLTGLVYDKVFGIRPWNYDNDDGNICGYTKWGLFCYWAFASFWLESLTVFLIYITPFVYKYFGY